MSTTIPYSQYREKFQAMIRRELTFGKSETVRRGFDKRGRLLLIEGRSVQILTPPRLQLRLAEYHKDRLDALHSCDARIRSLLHDAIETGVASASMEASLQDLRKHRDQISKQLKKIDKTLTQKARETDVRLIDLGKKQLQLSNSLASLADDMTKLFETNDPEYDKTAREFCRVNKQVLDVTHELDELTEQLYADDRFITTHDATFQQKTLDDKTDAIRVRLT